jgi:hypothetical protein
VSATGLQGGVGLCIINGVLVVGDSVVCSVLIPWRVLSGSRCQCGDAVAISVGCLLFQVLLGGSLWWCSLFQVFLAGDSKIEHFKRGPHLVEFGA